MDENRHPQASRERVNEGDGGGRGRGRVDRSTPRIQEVGEEVNVVIKERRLIHNKDEETRRASWLAVSFTSHHMHRFRHKHCSSLDSVHAVLQVEGGFVG